MSHEPIGWLNDVAFKNIFDVLMNDAVLAPQPSRGEFIADAPLNIVAVMRTLLTSHALRFWLNARAFWNSCCMVMTLPVFHPEMFALNTVLPLNMPWKLVALAVFHAEISELNAAALENM